MNIQTYLKCYCFLGTIIIHYNSYFDYYNDYLVALIIHVIQFEQ